MAAVTDAIEWGDAAVITSNCLAVDDAGARPQTGQGLDDQLGEIIARAAVEPHLCAVLAGQETVVLDFVQPFAA